MMMPGKDGLKSGDVPLPPAAPPELPRVGEGDRVGLLSSSNANDFALLQEPPSPAATYPAGSFIAPSTPPQAVPRTAQVSSFSLESPDDPNWAATRSQSLMTVASAGAPAGYPASQRLSSRKCSARWWWRGLAVLGIVGTIAVLVALSVPLMQTWSGDRRSANNNSKSSSEAVARQAKEGSAKAPGVFARSASDDPQQQSDGLTNITTTASPAEAMEDEEATSDVDPDLVESVGSNSCLSEDEAALCAKMPQNWWQGGIIYQIYPRSFQDSNGDGVGDLMGIVRRLSYLDSLNIDAVWLNPIYPSPMKDFGYDVSDFLSVDPAFGTLSVLRGLIRELHRRGIRFIMDLVPNHTSDVHKWFQDSKSSKKAEKRDWYVWSDGPNGTSPGSVPPNNWLSFFGGPAWTYDGATEQWYLHQYLPEMPDLNWHNPDVLREYKAIIRFWIAQGVDAFRVDSIPTLVEDPQLRNETANPVFVAGMDNPHDALFHIGRTQDVRPLHEIVRELRKTADAGGAVLICETYVPITELRRFYGDGLHECQLPFNFALIAWNGTWNGERMKKVIREYLDEVPRGGWPNWVLGNHDNSRVASRLGGEDAARMATTLLLTLPGTPTVYYGDELGMKDVPVPPEQVKDPAALRQPRDLWDIVGRDPERSPMSWVYNPSDKSAGFLASNATGPAWLPQAQGAAQQAVSVSTQAVDRASALTLFKRLSLIRAAIPALRGPRLVELDWSGSAGAVPSNVVAFVRPNPCGGHCGVSAEVCEADLTQQHTSYGTGKPSPDAKQQQQQRKAAGPFSSAGQKKSNDDSGAGKAGAKKMNETAAGGGAAEAPPVAAPSPSSALPQAPIQAPPQAPQQPSQQQGEGGGGGRRRSVLQEESGSSTVGGDAPSNSSSPGGQDADYESGSGGNSSDSRRYPPPPAEVKQPQQQPPRPAAPGGGGTPGTPASPAAAAAAAVAPQTSVVGAGAAGVLLPTVPTPSPSPLEGPPPSPVSVVQQLREGGGGGGGGGLSSSGSVPPPVSGEASTGGSSSSAAPSADNRGSIMSVLGGAAAGGGAGGGGSSSSGSSGGGSAMNAPPSTPSAAPMFPPAAFSAAGTGGASSGGAVVLPFAGGAPQPLAPLPPGAALAAEAPMNGLTRLLGVPFAAAAAQQAAAEQQQQQQQQQQAAAQQAAAAAAAQQQQQAAQQQGSISAALTGGSPGPNGLNPASLGGTSWTKPLPGGAARAPGAAAAAPGAIRNPFFVAQRPPRPPPPPPRPPSPPPSPSWVDLGQKGDIVVLANLGNESETVNLLVALEAAGCNAPTPNGTKSRGGAAAASAASTPSTSSSSSSSDATQQKRSSGEGAAASSSPAAAAAAAAPAPGPAATRPNETGNSEGDQAAGSKTSAGFRFLLLSSSRRPSTTPLDFTSSPPWWAAAQQPRPPATAPPSSSSAEGGGGGGAAAAATPPTSRGPAPPTSFAAPPAGTLGAPQEIADASGIQVRAKEALVILVVRL